MRGALLALAGAAMLGACASAPRATDAAVLPATAETDEYGVLVLAQARLFPGIIPEVK